MIKQSVALAFLVFASTTFAKVDGPCANFAKSAAIKAYKASVGTVQGSDGIEYEITKKLKARLPFHNYNVAISDNNEDGETWTNTYFVMTKLEGGVCKVLKVKQEETSASAVLKVQSFEDFDGNYLDEAVEIQIDKDFVENSGKYVDFRLFIDEDTYPTYCYEGAKEGVTDIINAILDVSTGDSFILSSEIKFDGDKVIHEGTYTAGSGDHDFALDFEINKCK